MRVHFCNCIVRKPRFYVDQLKAGSDILKRSIKRVLNLLHLSLTPAYDLHYAEPLVQLSLSSFRSPLNDV